MPILGIGVDLVHLPRISALISRRTENRLAAKILSPNETIDWQALQVNSLPSERVRFLAVRWSVKEAAYKALYPAVRPTWKELTYRSLTSTNKPSIEYHPIGPVHDGKVGCMHVSVSHDGEYVYSSVLAEATAR